MLVKLTSGLKFGMVPLSSGLFPTILVEISKIKHKNAIKLQTDEVKKIDERLHCSAEVIVVPATGWLVVKLANQIGTHI
jgi:hypothetical protein